MRCKKRNIACASGGVILVINEVKCTNGERVRFEGTPYYFKLTTGNKTWYWYRDTGKFDGTSFDIED